MENTLFFCEDTDFTENDIPKIRKGCTDRFSYRSGKILNGFINTIRQFNRYNRCFDFVRFHIIAFLNEWS